MPRRSPPAAFSLDAIALARRNTDYRRVLVTGTRSQLVAMAIPPRGEIGVERHPHVEQTFLLVRGRARAVVNGVARELRPGEALVVLPGAEHNVVNVGREPLKLLTVYAPPNHLDGRVHRTREDAERDTADEAFGRRAR